VRDARRPTIDDRRSTGVVRRTPIDIRFDCRPHLRRIPSFFRACGTLADSLTDPYTVDPANMRLTEYLKVSNIKVPLAARSKQDAIAELVRLLTDNQEVIDGPRVLQSVLDREATRTTGIGYGLAIPHGKTPGTDHLVMAVGKTAEPIDFQSIDGRPVSIIWLLVSPPDKTGQHITTLARISKLMMIDRFRTELTRAPDAPSVHRAVSEQESE
jgi:mannitol/fructose-specific phosphotransferase system IIA component (Ntr-type)